MKVAESNSMKIVKLVILGILSITVRIASVEQKQEGKFCRVRRQHEYDNTWVKSMMVHFIYTRTSTLSTAIVTVASVSRKCCGV